VEVLVLPSGSTRWKWNCWIHLRWWRGCHLGQCEPELGNLGGEFKIADGEIASGIGKGDESGCLTGGQRVVQDGRRRRAVVEVLVLPFRIHQIEVGLWDPFRMAVRGAILGSASQSEIIDGEIASGVGKGKESEGLTRGSMRIARGSGACQPKRCRPCHGLRCCAHWSKLESREQYPGCVWGERQGSLGACVNHPVCRGWHW
jgi:hypothetical protein